jgi:hypothetical protein
MGRWTVNPKIPPVQGQITLDVYDRELWDALAAEATAREIPLAFLVHRVLDTYAKRSARLIQWRKEQDSRDPDLVEIQRFLADVDTEASTSSLAHTPPSARARAIEGSHAEERSSR